MFYLITQIGLHKFVLGKENLSTYYLWFWQRSPTVIVAVRSLFSLSRIRPKISRSSYYSVYSLSDPTRSNGGETNLIRLPRFVFNCLYFVEKDCYLCNVTCKLFHYLLSSNSKLWKWKTSMMNSNLLLTIYNIHFSFNLQIFFRVGLSVFIYNLHLNSTCMIVSFWYFIKLNISLPAIESPLSRIWKCTPSVQSFSSQIQYALDWLYKKIVKAVNNSSNYLPVYWILFCFIFEEFIHYVIPWIKHSP